MPYVRERTVLPLAPRIAGLSLPESQWGFAKRKGMGQVSAAICPSSEQLEGIVDMNDPCQNPVAALPVSLPASSPVTSAINNFQVLGTQNSLTAWLQQNQTTVLIAGGLLFGIALFAGMGKR